MRNATLSEKLGNSNYLEALSDRRYRELMFCKEMLSDKELNTETSIQVAYHKARDKFIDEILPRVNPELAERAKEEKIPVFNMIKILEEYSIEED